MISCIECNREFETMYHIKCNECDGYVCRECRHEIGRYWMVDKKMQQFVYNITCTKCYTIIALTKPDRFITAKLKEELEKRHGIITVKYDEEYKNEVHRM